MYPNRQNLPSSCQMRDRFIIRFPTRWLSLWKRHVAPCWPGTTVIFKSTLPYCTNRVTPTFRRFVSRSVDKGISCTTFSYGFHWARESVFRFATSKKPPGLSVSLLTLRTWFCLYFPSIYNFQYRDGAQVLAGLSATLCSRSQATVLARIFSDSSATRSR